MTGYLRIYNSTSKLLDLIAAGRWRDATDQWGAIQGVVSAVTNGVNFYNILKWGGSEPSSLMKGKVFPLLFFIFCTVCYCKICYICSPC